MLFNLIKGDIYNNGEKKVTCDKQHSFALIDQFWDYWDFP